MTRARILPAVATMALILGSAPAQDPVMALNPTTMTGFAGTVAADQLARRQFGSAITSRTRRAAPAKSTLSRLVFRPNSVVRQRVYDRAVALVKKTSPPAAVQLRQIFASGEIAKQVNSYLRRYGLSSSNLADTTTLYLAQAWLATRGSNGDPTRAQMIGLRNQVVSTYSTMPALLRASDAQKQEISEANIIQAAFASSVAESAARDPKTLATGRPQVAQGVMSLYGLDLLKLKLTDQGFR